ncbi:MAG: DNA adenine methylase [Gammaproteobacteria bacterium]|nr:DNA adenine methylase [Gammaproteobacteria bacterium]
MHYPGGKGVSGVYQRIINQIPPHRVYIETHLGGGAIMRHKKLAEVNIGVDLDMDVSEAWQDAEQVQFVCADAVDYLGTYPFNGEEFVYADPPYLACTRRSHRSLYKYDYTKDDHVELLKTLVSLPCQVMISSYRSSLYKQYLSRWRTLRYCVRTRSGAVAEEYLWMNYPAPVELHDYRHLGDSFRERERIRRRNEGWKKRIESLTTLERNALLAHVFKH